MTTWRPDTCECVLTYSGSTDKSGELELVSYENKCSAHTALEDSSAYTQVLTENRSKNKIVNLVKTDYNKEAEWSFNEKRELVIKAGLTEEEKNDLISKLVDIKVNVE